MSISCIRRVAGRPRPFNEYSPAGALLRRRPELVERNVKLRAGRRILDLRLPVGDAHRVMPEQNEQTPVVNDEIADPHLIRSRGHRRSLSLQPSVFGPPAWIPGSAVPGRAIEPPVSGVPRP